MPQTVLQIVTDASRFINLIQENEQLSAEQGAAELQITNDYLLGRARDGLDLGWYPQTALANTAPLEDEDIFNVKLVLAKVFAVYYGIEGTLSQEAKDLIKKSEDMLDKRAVKYFESDMSNLPVPQGAYWGGGSVNS